MFRSNKTMAVRSSVLFGNSIGKYHLIELLLLAHSFMHGEKNTNG